MKGLIMKRFNSLGAAVLLISVFFSANFALAYQPLIPGERITINSTTFSKNILTALDSENDGLKISAMQQVLKYKDLIDINKSAVALMRIYRSSKYEKVRKLALVAIHSIQNDWALGILKRDLYFEKSPAIKDLMIAVLNNDVEKFKRCKDIAAFLQ